MLVEYVENTSKVLSNFFTPLLFKKIKGVGQDSLKIVLLTSDGYDTTHATSSVSFYGTIDIYLGEGSAPPPQWTFRETLLHDIGHLFFIQVANEKDYLGLKSNLKQWTQEANQGYLEWKEIDDQPISSRAGSFISDNAMRGPEEEATALFTSLLLGHKITRQGKPVDPFLRKKMLAVANEIIKAPDVISPHIYSCIKHWIQRYSLET